ncbi:hypothetical protein ACK3TF_002954 [Chlorella vulgaris]
MAAPPMLSDDDMNQLFAVVPNYQQNQRLQQECYAKVVQRKRAEQQRAAAQVQVQREAQEVEEDEAAAEGHAVHMSRLREQITLGVNLEEFREHETVLLALPPGEEPASCELSEGYLEAVQAAAQTLGLDLAQEAAAADQQEQLLLQDMFRCGLRSGFVRTIALQRGEVGRPLVQALHTTMTQSPDAETAGAAFVTLMALMGDAAGSGYGGSSGAAGNPSSGPSSGVDSIADCLMLEAHYGLPAVQGGGAPPPAAALACIPSDAQLLEALRANGYRSAGKGSKQQQKGGGPEGGPAGTAGGGEEETSVRLQTVKLILRTAAAVCRYCRKNPEAAATAGATSREGLAELLLAAMHMGLDKAATQLQRDLDAVVLELLAAFEEADWQRKLPQLAERLMDMGPSDAARLKLLKKLPMGHPRGMALQQFAAVCLLERLLPAAQQGSARSAVNRRAADALDPVAVISAQPWLADPKALVAGATSGGGKAPRGGYLIGVLELLLKVCHLLLWPHMLTHVQDEPSCMTAAFLDDWLRFLLGLQKHIKNLQPEDQAVKVLATYLELEYRSLAEFCVPMSP